MRPRPVLHCFVFRPIEHPEGPRFDLWQRVSLEQAEVKMRQGWVVIGPDPHDEADLAVWLQEMDRYTTYFDPGDER